MQASLIFKKGKNYISRNYNNEDLLSERWG
jgi:hypothetical protein